MEDRERLETARKEALESIDANIPWFSVWDEFKKSVTVIVDKELRNLVNGTDSLIRRGLINTPKRMRRWINDFMLPEEVGND